MSAASRSSFRWVVILDLLACIASFAAAWWLFTTLLAPDYGLELEQRWKVDLALSSLIAWVGIELLGGGWRGGLRNWFDLSFCAVGINLVVQYGLNYFAVLQPVPWPIALAGGICGVALIGGIRKVFGRGDRDKPSILLVGFDAVTAALAIPLQARIIGVLESEGNAACAAAGQTRLGDFSRFEDVIAAHRPQCIIMTGSDWMPAISTRRLFDLHCSGVTIEDAPAVYEDVLQRVCWQRLRPVDLLLASPMTGNRSVKTLQAVYTNVAALALLLASLPLMVVLSILAAIFNGGAVFETVPCCGLQRIPFRLLRFRTRRRDGSPSWVGNMIISLRLVNLPQLWNVVRGEMGLFGPPPVRMEFAGRLSQLLSAYPHRFAVKPGVLGWSQANLKGAAQVPDDGIRLGYDLYYAKQQSPSFDIDILLRTMFRAADAGRRAAGA